MAPDPLHGLTLERILVDIVDHYGFAELAVRIPIHCFEKDPTIKSSLKFLRKTPWARTKVESFYLYYVREMKRAERYRARVAAPAGAENEVKTDADIADAEQDLHVAGAEQDADIDGAENDAENDADADDVSSLS